VLTKIRDSFYLHQHFRLCKRPHFYTRRTGKSPVKNSRRARPDLGIVLDIDYVDRRSHRSTGGFDNAIYA
jgi:hypothetical protein